MNTVVSVTLPLGRTFAWRAATYITLRPGYGVLEYRAGPAPELSEMHRCYAVTEVADADGFRTFRLRRPTRRAFVQVRIMPHRRTAVEDDCECRRGRAGRECLHVAALRALIEAGRLPRMGVNQT